MFKLKSTGTMSRRFGAAAATLALAGTGLFAGAGSAAAGTNGQQLSFSSSFVDKVYACGSNQNGVRVCSGWRDVSSPTWTDLHGYWWKGAVDVYGLKNGVNYVYAATCYVPEKQSGDWYFCNTGGKI
ncbi:hypothetical protein GCM10015535_66920 [Streptomyces gelaticus]|uniref:Secreted protein n=1 Tax=Streptomyces gelaticus TaxID=285446 RepID=A0ABQ2WBK6_9ACTN|nr:hypothetical protein [Streptomyces gelaticus]GGV96809.1 hypothetical protein GCM10015535_66920 [Streptomyces gelaticus]